MTPTRDIYERAAAHIERFSLFRSGLVLNPDRPCESPACAGGAILIAANGDAQYRPDWWDLMRPLHFALRLDGRSGVISAWSDKAGQNDVVCTLRAIAGTLP